MRDDCDPFVLLEAPGAMVLSISEVLPAPGEAISGGGEQIFQALLSRLQA